MERSLIILTQISHEGEATASGLELAFRLAGHGTRRVSIWMDSGRCIPRKFSEGFFWGYATLVTIGKLLIAIGREH